MKWVELMKVDIGRNDDPKPQNIKRGNKWKSGLESRRFILRRKFRKRRIVLRRRIKVLVFEFI